MKKSVKLKKESVEKREAWFRILVLIISGIILMVWKWLIVILIVLNWLITVIYGKRSKKMAEFCEYWNTEVYKYVRYITFVTNSRPFPFSDLKRLSKFEK